MSLHNTPPFSGKAFPWSPVIRSPALRNTTITALILKDLAREFNARFLFETNVGAGLPVIGTLNDLLRSGDTVRRIEAVLSGTLNFVFNHYNGDRPFSDRCVRQAQEEGYTEPDPRLDLSGTDVMRKILILARESGEKTEMEDIENPVLSSPPPAWKAA